jgi:hypothetical protein
MDFLGLRNLDVISGTSVIRARASNRHDAMRSMTAHRAAAAARHQHLQLEGDMRALTRAGPSFE